MFKSRGREATWETSVKEAEALELKRKFGSKKAINYFCFKENNKKRGLSLPSC